MKDLAKAFGSLSAFNKGFIVVVLGAWLLLTVALVQGWQSTQEAKSWLSGQMSLGVLINLAQITMLVNIWYRLGSTNANMRHYRNDVEGKFRVVQIEQNAQDRRENRNREQLAKLRGEMEIIKELLKNENTGNLAGEIG